MSVRGNDVLQAPVARADQEDDAAPSRTDMRHLRIVVDLLKAHGLMVASVEVMRAVTEIEQTRPAIEHYEATLGILRRSLNVLDKAEATLQSKLHAWNQVDATLLKKEQRMERREWEMGLRQDVEYARRRLLATVRLLSQTIEQRPLTAQEKQDRALSKATEPTSPHEWLEGRQGE